MKADLLKSFLHWEPNAPRGIRQSRALAKRIPFLPRRAVAILCQYHCINFHIDADLYSVVVAVVSFAPSAPAVDPSLSLITQLSSNLLLLHDPCESGDNPPWTWLDLSSINFGLPALTLFPRLAARPRACFCCC